LKYKKISNVCFISIPRIENYMVSCPSPQGSQHKILIEQAIQQVTEETISHQVPRMRKLLRGGALVACIIHIVCAKKIKYDP
jgi:hypothetical protein